MLFPFLAFLKLQAAHTFMKSRSYDSLAAKGILHTVHTEAMTSNCLSKILSRKLENKQMDAYVLGFQ